MEVRNLSRKRSFMEHLQVGGINEAGATALSKALFEIDEHEIPVYYCPIQQCFLEYSDGRTYRIRNCNY